MRILVIEDDTKISSYIEQGLKENDYEVDAAFDGEQGQNMAEGTHYDVIVSDIMLPKRDGLTIVRNLRAKGCTVPVIFLSAKATVEDRVAGFEIGANDYLGKPFAISELTARIQVLTLRSGAHKEPPQTVLTHGDLTVDLLARTVTRAGKKIDLQTKEFSLLEFLMQNAEKTVTKTQILEQLWGYKFDPQTNVVDVLVCRLRNKIDKNFETPKIHTIRGVGYVLK